MVRGIADSKSALKHTDLARHWDKPGRTDLVLVPSAFGLFRSQLAEPRRWLKACVTRCTE